MKARKTVIMIGYICLAIITAGTAAYFFKSCTTPDPAKMTAAQIQTFITSQDFNSLPREQKRAFFEKAMDTRVENYFNTLVENRTEYLDKIIDERKNSPPPDANRPPPGPDPNMMRNFKMPTPEQMRARKEMRDPVKEAKRREFFDALRARSQQRGIQIGPPGGPGGGGPPPGGGPPDGGGPLG
jgi:hypothetical protein